ncbi:hypothetical protein OC835_000901 [Tilletia horrida]|nr:hypothetical protein OC835_000901 [Tilletia horrida]
MATSMDACPPMEREANVLSLPTSPNSVPSSSDFYSRASISSISSVSTSSSLADPLSECSGCPPPLGLGISCPLPPPRPGRRRAKITSVNPSSCSIGHAPSTVMGDDGHRVEVDVVEPASVEWVSQLPLPRPNYSALSWSKPVETPITWAVSSAASPSSHSKLDSRRKKFAAERSSSADSMESTSVLCHSENAYSADPSIYLSDPTIWPSSKFSQPNGMLHLPTYRPSHDDYEEEEDEDGYDEDEQVYNLDDTMSMFSGPILPASQLPSPDLRTSDSDPYPRKSHTPYHPPQAGDISPLLTRSEQNTPELRSSLRRMFSDMALMEKPVPRHLSKERYVYYRKPELGSMDEATPAATAAPAPTSGSSALISNLCGVRGQSPVRQDQMGKNKSKSGSAVSSTTSSPSLGSVRPPRFPRFASAPAAAFPTASAAEIALPPSPSPSKSRGRSSAITSPAAAAMPASPGSPNPAAAELRASPAKTRTNKFGRRPKLSRPSTSTFGAGGTVFAFGFGGTR